MIRKLITIRSFFSFVLIFIPLFVIAQSNDIFIGKTESFYSNILKENRKIWIHIPKSGGKYPVIYLLDGSDHFQSVVAMTNYLSTIFGNSICPKLIVVGIINTNRNRDLTPTKGDKNHPYVDSILAEESGGGEDFIKFIEKELFPYVESKYQVQPYRIFIGHSYGGLTVLHTLFHYPNFFNAYIAIDPSLWWSDQELLKKVKNQSTDKRLDGIPLFLGFANTMEEGMDTTRVMKDSTYSTMHIRSILEFNHVLEKKYENILRFKMQFYPSDDHTSVPFIAEYDALRFIFDFYKFNYHNSDRDNPNIDLFNKINLHYQMVSKNLGYDEKPSMSFVNSIGYYYLEKKQFDKAEQFFKLNITNYPSNSDVYNSFGEYFLTIGNNEKAIENYKKLLELDPQNDNAKTMIRQLENK